jgi:hypothetical protein
MLKSMLSLTELCVKSVYLGGGGHEVHETFQGGGEQATKVWEPLAYCILIQITVGTPVPRQQPLYHCLNTAVLPCLHISSSL